MTESLISYSTIWITGFWNVALWSLIGRNKVSQESAASIFRQAFFF
jgi:hypothetical protein